MGGTWIMSQHIPDDKWRSDLGNLHELRGKGLAAQVSQTRQSVLYSRTGVVLMLQLESSWHGRSVDHVLTYSGYKSRSHLRKLHELRGKRLVAQVSQTRQFANQSGYNAPFGVVLAWEERGLCLNIFRTTNCGRISKAFTNYEAKDLLRNRLGMGGAWIMSQHIPDDKSRSDLRNLPKLRDKRLVAQVSQTRRFPLYSRTGVVLMLQLDSSWHGRSVDHLSTYSRRQIAVGSQKPSRITRQKTYCARGPWIMSQHILDDKSRSDLRNLHELRGKRLVAQVSQTRQFANQSGNDAPIGVVLAWEERGSCFNIFRTSNRGRISETFMNYEAKDLLRNESNTLVLVVFANRSGFDAPIRFVLAWEERGSCLNIFWMKDRGRISETFTNYDAKDLLNK
ncbi:uncharacterized protein G2W53_033678 [Senna tora]|uniref:Uncharacterized protein n=1 Tax=Senna tora TaxID=362788 RepID=A0A834T2M6_9FABA|nr:uncharacterized protein G2W53_033678 [Senna tora]